MSMKVGFKLGTQARLNQLTGYEAGSFYLTNDSNRLYFAQATDKLVDLNQYVRTVSNVAALPTTTSNPSLQAGDFYYAITENVFCIRNGTNSGWTQINPDTYLKASTSAVTVGSVTDGASITTSVEDSAANKVTGNFSIVGGTDVTVTADAANRKITINSTAHDTTYELTTATNNSGATITLDATADNDTDSDITITSTEPSLLTVKSDDKGNITLTPTNQLTKKVTNNFSDKGVFTTTVTDTEDHVSTGITPIIKYGSTEVEAKFLSGTADLDVYTITEANQKIADEIAKSLRTADAMHFAGTVGTGGTVNVLPDITTVGNGTTYKALTALSSPDAKVGDIIVAFGTENATTGKITNGEWLVIPSGDDQALVGTATTSTVTIKDNKTDDQIAAVTIKGIKNNPVKVGGVVSTGAADKAHTTFTVEHANGNTVGTKGGTTTAAVSQSAKSSAEFTAITKVVVDEYGHVSSAEAQKLTVVDTHNSVKSNKLIASGGSAADAIGGTVTVSSTVNTADEGDVTGTMTMTSGSLHIAGTTADNKGAINIDLIWGSF